MYTDLQIVTWKHNFGGHVYCGLCGKNFDANFVSAALVRGDGEIAPNQIAPQGAIALDVCPDCLTAGARGAAERIKKRAAELREQAADLDALAIDVNGMHPENWVTVRELESEQAVLPF